eukprot:m51a1_g8040 hypothetical protein (776) ;mRNA; r:61760-65362
MHLSHGPSGFRIAHGPHASHLLGYDVDAGADVNGDAVGDIVIGYPGFGILLPGSAYLVFGARSRPSPALLTIPGLAATPGALTELLGVYAADKAGSCVAFAGDFNGDGIADVAVCAPDNAPLNLSSVGSPDLPGLVIRGAPRNCLGSDVHAAGDVNGDRIDDIVVGAEWDAPSSAGFSYGKAYVVYGRRWWPQGSLELDGLPLEQGFAIEGWEINQRLGLGLSSGDFDGDGLTDVVAASQSISGDAPAYVAYGMPTSTRAEVTTKGIANDSAAGFVATCGTRPVLSVAGVGDLNGDGADELALNYHILFGRKGARMTGVVAADKVATPHGFALGFPGYIHPGGDLNGDRVHDIAITHFISASFVVVHVLFGRAAAAGAWPSVVDVGAGEFAGCDAGNSFVIDRGMPSGNGVAAGDINGDGVSDLVLCFIGAVHVVYGVSQPVVTAANVTVARGQRTVLSGEQLAVRADSPRAEVIVHVASVAHGHFALAPSHNTSVEQFTMQDIDEGRMEFVHDGSAVAPSFTVAVSALRAGCRQSTPVAATVVLVGGSSVLVVRKELAKFERSFRQYYQMHHEDYTPTRIRQGKLPLVFVVAAAWEVRNPVLEAWYEARRRFMAEELRRTEEELEERVAFHGTLERNVGPICDHGLLRVGHPLNPSHSTDTGFFGDPRRGVYASRFVEYTLQYSNCRVASDGHEFPCPVSEGDSVKIVMFKALPGLSLHMKSVAVAVPPTAGYDSHSSPQWAEWFFFDETQLCPTHVVEVLAITNRRTEANEGL